MRAAQGSICAAVIVTIAVAAQACASRSTPPVSRLGALVTAFDRASTPYFPFTASEAGLRQYDRVLANTIGEEYRTGLAALCSRYHSELRRIEPATLDEHDRLTRDIFQFNLETCVERLRLPWHLLPVDQVGRSLPSEFAVIGAGRGVHPFKTPRNYEDFLGRIDGFVTWMDTAIANMRTGMERGITQPRDIMVKMLPQLEVHIVADPRASVFYEPIKNLPPDFDEATRNTLTDKYVRAIEGQIVPAYRRLRAFVHDEYLPRCRATFGLADLPGGSAMYAFSVRVGTTTNLTPEQIFALGEQEVTRISREIDQLNAEITVRRRHTARAIRECGRAAASVCRIPGLGGSEATDAVRAVSEGGLRDPSDRSVPRAVDALELRAGVARRGTPGGLLPECRRAA